MYWAALKAGPPYGQVMKVALAPTDAAWAAHLRGNPQHSEANFWFPNPQRNFRAIDSGELFLFKSKWAEGNRLIGGGYLSGYAVLTVNEAWDLFGRGNGVTSHAALLKSIQHYRKDEDPNPQIGCVLLRDIFFSESAPPAPPDFAKNSVRLKVYDLSAPSGAYLRGVLDAVMLNTQARESTVPGDMFGEHRLVRPRLGQQAFKGLVLTAYERQCAITGGRIGPVLEAAHIRPVAASGEHRLSNGLLLRSDVHTLFDRGYLGIDVQHRLQVSPRLRIDFGNGREFYERSGQQIHVPHRQVDRPAPDAVEWHMDTVFQHA